jgi:hypothetical protein
MIAYCGLNCRKCNAFVATRENDDQKREETARNWGQLFQVEIKPGQINCQGCKAEGLRFFHCNACEIRNCCVSRGLETCAGCEKYICDILAAFIKLIPPAGATLAGLRIREL